MSKNQCIPEEFSFEKGPWDRFASEIQRFTDIRIRRDHDSELSSYRLCLYFYQFSFLHDGGHPIETRLFINGPQAGGVEPARWDAIDFHEDMIKEIETFLRDIRRGKEKEVSPRFKKSLRDRVKKGEIDIAFLDLTGMRRSPVVVDPDSEIEKAVYHITSEQLVIFRKHGARQTLSLAGTPLAEFLETLDIASSGATSVQKDMQFGFESKKAKASSCYKNLQRKGLHPIVLQRSGCYLASPLLTFASKRENYKRHQSIPDHLDIFNGHSETF